MDKQTSDKVEMTQRWMLIQRASEREAHGESRSGVDRILSFDYMGSAEFEFGSVSNSFKLYRQEARAGNLVISKSGSRMTGGKPWHMLHHKDFDPLQVEDTIVKVSTGKIHTKESTYFDYWLPQCASWWSEPPATVWVVLPHDGHRQTSNNFVIWAVSSPTLHALHRELCQEAPTQKGVHSEVLPTPVVHKTAEDLRVFDTVTIKLRTGAQTPATVVGIHDRCIDVKLPDGSRLKGIPYTNIIE